MLRIYKNSVGQRVNATLLLSLIHIWNANGATITNTGYGFWANGGNWNVSNAQSSNSLLVGFRASNSGVLNLVNISSESDNYGVRVSTASGVLTLINGSVRQAQIVALHNLGGVMISENVSLDSNTLDLSLIHI